MRVFGVLAVAVIGGTVLVEAQTTIYWKKDHIYANGKEIAIVYPRPTDLTLPTVPGSFERGTTTATSVVFTWAASSDSGGSGLAGYRIYRGSVPVGSTAVGTNTFTDNTLKPNTAYSYTVRSIDNAQNLSNPSTTRSFTTPNWTGETTAPSVPLQFTGRALSSTVIRLDWLASTDAGGSGVVGYKVYRSGVLISGTNPINALTFQDTGRTPNTQYSYTVKSQDGAGNLSVAAGPINVTTLP